MVAAKEGIPPCSPFTESKNKPSLGLSSVQVFL